MEEYYRITDTDRVTVDARLRADLTLVAPAGAEPTLNDADPIDGALYVKNDPTDKRFYAHIDGEWIGFLRVDEVASGPAGADGADGADGAIGPIGPAGADGADGAPGPVGPIGPAGADGAPGAAGAVGPAGAAGADGAPGAPGAVGPIGPAGADGAPGAVGPAGAAGPGVPAGGTAGQILSKVDGTNYNTQWINRVEAYSFAVSDETTDLAVGTSKVSFRMPYAFTLSSVRASLNVAAAGSSFIVNIKENGVTIFSTNLSIDSTELTSTTAAVPAVISDASLADDSLITVDIVQVGSTTAGKGLKISFIGTKS